MSSASYSAIGHSTFGLCVAGFLIVPNRPIRRFANPLCSPLSVSVFNELIARMGLQSSLLKTPKVAKSLEVLEGSTRLGGDHRAKNLCPPIRKVIKHAGPLAVNWPKHARIATSPASF